MINYSNRGKLFEKIILKGLNRNKKLGIFFKSPTPIKPIEIKYNNKSPLITKAIFESKSLCDFYGLYRNKFILIEAKEIHSTNFNLNNIKVHQINQLIKINDLGGIALVVINFLKQDECFCLEINTFLNLSDNNKSIKYIEIIEKGYKLEINGLNINILDYLETLFP